MSEDDQIDPPGFELENKTRSGLSSVIMGILGVGIYPMALIIFIAIDVFVDPKRNPMSLCIVFVVIGLACSIAGLVQGIMAVTAEEKPGPLDPQVRGRAKMGIILSSVGLALSALFGILTILMIWDYYFDLPK